MAYVVNVFDLKEWDIWFAAGSAYRDTKKIGKTAKTFCQEQRADLCFNLAFFNMANYDTVNFVRTRQFGDVGYGGIDDKIIIDNTNQCGGYDYGYRNGVLVNKNKSGRRTRNGIGKTKSGKIIIAQSTSKVTEYDFCLNVGKNVTKYFNEQVDDFFMEDGGGSTQEYSNISKINTAPEGGRKVATVTCVKRKSTLPKITRTLKTGCKGDDVKLLQTVLGGIEVDGSFGSGTKAAVKAAQKNLGLKVDGSCGPLTLAALGLS